MKTIFTRTSMKPIGLKKYDGELIIIITRDIKIGEHQVKNIKCNVIK